MGGNAPDVSEFQTSRKGQSQITHPVLIDDVNNCCKFASVGSKLNQHDTTNLHEASIQLLADGGGSSCGHFFSCKLRDFGLACLRQFEQTDLKQEKNKQLSSCSVPDG
jgi:hypothetical protein